MAHFAKVLNGKVINVIVADQDFIDNMVDDSPGKWIQTSYNTFGGVHYERTESGKIDTPSEDQSKSLRKNFAGVGMIYDKSRDAFYLPQPFPSWTLNEDTCKWECPVPQPVADEDNPEYKWNEETQTWDAVTE